MKRKINLYLILVILLCFSITAGAQQSMRWVDNAGFDSDTGENWKIDAGTLVGWTNSNFETLAYQASGKSEVVGTGITVDRIKLDWEYPTSVFINKGENRVERERLDQNIDYTVVVFAEISSVLKMNIFGNGGWNSSNDEFKFFNGEKYISEMNLMVFSPSMGGIIDAGWNFIELDAVDYATGLGADSYINACDLWSANLWANVPYGFAVSSAGLGASAGLVPLLSIEMRYLEILDAGIVSQESGLSSLNNELTNNSDWVGDYVLNETGVEIGQYDAGQNTHINMQFRVPIKGAPAGRYHGEVTFSTYTI